MTPEEFLKQLEIELKIVKYSNHTLRNYLRINRDLLDLVKKQPEDITQQDVKLFMAERLTNNSSSATLQALASIRFAYSNILKKDPTFDIRRPKKEKKIPTVLTIDEVFQLINAAKTRKSRLMLNLLYATGMRVSELSNLKKQDLYYDEGIGTIRQAKGKKDRQFRIPENLKGELMDFCASNDNEYVFSGKKGKLSTRNIYNIVNLTAKRAGIKKSVHPHTLRHSYGTHSLEKGVDLRTIQIFLGHERLDTTELYLTISSERLKKTKSIYDIITEERKSETNHT